LLLLALPVRRAPPEPAPESRRPSNPQLKTLCDKNVKKYNNAPCYSGASTVAFIMGKVGGRSVGMTLLGMALQGFVLLLSLVTVYVLVGPGLPILIGWSARWMGLVARLPAREVIAKIAGTSN
jgi:hypothetical protein